MIVLATLHKVEGAALVGALENTTPGKRVHLSREQIVWSSSKVFADEITSGEFVINGRQAVVYGRIAIDGKPLDHITLRRPTF